MTESGGLTWGRRSSANGREYLATRFPADMRLAEAAGTQAQSTLRDLLVRAAEPGIVSFALGMPADELLPADALSEAGRRVLAADQRALQYRRPSQALKSQIVGLMARRGVVCGPEQVFLTAGAQQGMELLTRLFLDPGGSVLLEQTIYDGLLMAVNRVRPKILTLPTDPETGVDTAAIESHLAAGARPAFVYVIPEGHNPLGVSMSRAKREHLVDLAERYSLPIIEDDAYGFLRYDRRAAPPLRALDDRWVFYLGSFSKILAPALRVGWIVLPEDLVPRLSALKHAADIDCATFAQQMVAEYLRVDRLAAHISTVRAEYRRRRDVMVDAVRRHLPDGTRATCPGAGFYLWLELPRGVDTTELLASAIEHERVAFTPGRAFASDDTGSADSCLRLSFAGTAAPLIEEGAARLGRAVRRFEEGEPH